MRPNPSTNSPTAVKLLSPEPLMEEDVRAFEEALTVQKDKEAAIKARARADASDRFLVFPPRPRLFFSPS